MASKGGDNVVSHGNDFENVLKLIENTQNEYKQYVINNNNNNKNNSSKQKIENKIIKCQT